MCYLHAEGFSGGALKHGPFALIQVGLLHFRRVLFTISRGFGFVVRFVIIV
jgi:fructoselysine-6-P-deglycase FrlB-like protein